MRRSEVLMLLAALCTGLLISTGLQDPTVSTTRGGNDLTSLARTEQEAVAEAESFNDDLRTEIDYLTQSSSTNTQIETTDSIQVEAGAVAVTGPGLTVILTDAPTPAQIPQGRSVDDYVVHQQDIEGVINALWAGGAEAIMVQGKRIVSTSTIRCVGNVILIEGQTFSPPYEITAVGDPQALQAGLDSSNAVRIYLQYVDLIDLGWEVDQEQVVEIPAYTGKLQFSYASIQES